MASVRLEEELWLFVLDEAVYVAGIQEYLEDTSPLQGRGRTDGIDSAGAGEGAGEEAVEGTSAGTGERADERTGKGGGEGPWEWAWERARKGEGEGAGEKAEEKAGNGAGEEVSEGADEGAGEKAGGRERAVEWAVWSTSSEYEDIGLEEEEGEAPMAGGVLVCCNVVSRVIWCLPWIQYIDIIYSLDCLASFTSLSIFRK